MAKRKRKQAKSTKSTLFSSLIVLFALVWGIWGKYGNQLKQINTNKSNEPQSGVISNANRANTSYGGLSSQDYQKLANLNFQSGNRGYVYVNNNKSTLIKNAWQVNKVVYSNLDSLNRTSTSNTAFLEPCNVANDSLRVRQFIQPTAWHSNRKSGTQIYNRGHLIAYSVSAGIDQDGQYNPNNQSGDQNNPKNLFTQTAFSNQKIQTIFETKVRQALRQGNKVIYQATPIFRGNELMARGINLQAIGVTGNLDFNVYIFNVQPGYSFDYNTGRALVDRSMEVIE
ncbi:DNA/RNA non-specific endonuclease [Lactobacillus sp. PV034]|uniref:DNA/RNA non-specific endonuclease n=1 Tax=Lactobacillus sp. PV034 TaxID=2594495 RepID=UPI00223F67F7|nr:DNA/RNA non-specific endonuclease [Lactobacillus sp. PV034]QNQ81312.1 DNA/RNA non-specific endonuclease [Lactobacillus sp. PV034]